jgi:hypothetical protein
MFALVDILQVLGRAFRHGLDSLLVPVAQRDVGFFQRELSHFAVPTYQIERKDYRKNYCFWYINYQHRSLNKLANKYPTNN